MCMESRRKYFCENSTLEKQLNELRDMLREERERADGINVKHLRG